MKDFEKKLRETSKILPKHEPKAEAWDTISQWLDFNDKLASTAREMPVHEPYEDAWGNVEIQIKPRQKFYKTRIIAIGLSAAASVTILIAIWFLNRQNNQGKLTVTEEVVNDWKQPALFNKDTASQKVLQFIDEQCNNKSYICHEPEFIQKKEQLKEVDDQIKVLEQVINTSGSSSSLVRTHIKLENLKSRLMKDIINMIAS
jgi:hypothetical protein